MPADPSPWGGAELTVTVSGVDVTCDCLEVTVDRSKNRLWDPADAGVCQVLLFMEPGGQPASRGPVGAQVRVHVAYGATGRYLFTGEVQDRELRTDPERTVLALSCVDEFERLARLNWRADPLDSPVGAGEAVQQRISRWLNEAGSSSDRDMGSSDMTCPGTLIDGNALRLIQVTALADGGDVYIAGDGTVTFLPWRWRDDAPFTAVFSDRLLHDWVPYSAATYRDDLDEVQNRVTGTRREPDDDKTPQTAVNPSSVSTYGERGDPLDDLELEDDGQVATRVDRVVAVAAQPNPRFDSVVVQPGVNPSRSWPRTIPVTFGTLLAANRVWPDGTQAALYGHCIGEIWRFTPTDATVEFRVSGTGTWDTDRPPRPPLALERCPDGTLRVPEGYPCDQTSTVLIKDADGNVLATYPPGSLCECGVVEVPDGGVEICLDDGEVQICVPIDDPRLDAILWFDVLDPGPDLIERIEGTPLDPLPGFDGTRLDVIPGGFDAIDATADGGPIVFSTSGRLATTPLDGGWIIDVWLDVATDAVAVGEFLTIIDLGSVQVRVTGEYGDPGDPVQVEVVVVDGSAVEHLSGPLAPLGGTWTHYVIRWRQTTDHLYLDVDGVLVYDDAFPFAPFDPEGDWAVVLPGDASIGELLVYAGEPVLGGDYDGTVIADGPVFYWRLGEEVDSGGLSDYDDAIVADGPEYFWRLESET